MDGLLIVFLLLALTAAAWLLLWPALPRIRGRLGKWRVHYALRHSLPASHYRVFRDVTLRPGAGSDQGASKIDHVVISPYGVFVVETKSYSGSISGSERDPHWTRARYRARRGFRNPLHQNHGHIRKLSELFGIDASRFHSLVVFTGSARFSTPMPAQVTQLGGLIPFIQVRNRELIAFEEVERLAGLLQSSRVAPGVESAAAHLAALRQSHGSRFSARQAMLGLGLMAALVVAAGSLVHLLMEIPGRYPSVENSARVSPFVPDAAPPRIDLPGARAPAGPNREATSPAERLANVEKAPVAQRASVRQPLGSDDHLAWESTLMCAYAVESRRCACYDPAGRKAELDYPSCRKLADKSAGAGGPDGR